MPKYKNVKFAQEEEELLELENQERDNQEDELDNEEPDNPEEKSWKKRYGDLRRHSQKEIDDRESRITALEEQVSELSKKELKFPKTEEEVAAWIKKYPDVAAIMRTLAMKEVAETKADIDRRLEDIAKKEAKSAKKIARDMLAKAHPDFFDEIRNDEAFHEWLETKSKRMQDALYDNDTDWQAASEVIDLYKAEKNITTKKREDKRDAAREVNTGRSDTKPSGQGEFKFSESQVQAMSQPEFERNAEEIDKAIKEGKFLFDLSGAAR